jgi:hypothetical protein
MTSLLLQDRFHASNSLLFLKFVLNAYFRSITCLWCTAYSRVRGVSQRLGDSLLEHGVWLYRAAVILLHYF